MTNLDAFIGLVLALTVSVLGLTNAVDQEVVNSAILLVLGLLAQAMLRDRLRRRTTEREVRQVISDTRDRLTDLVPQMREITGPEGALNRAREAIDSVSMVRVLHGSEVGRHSPRRGGTPTSGASRAAPAPSCALSRCRTAWNTPGGATPRSPSRSRSSTRPTRRSASGTRGSGAASTRTRRASRGPSTAPARSRTRRCWPPAGTCSAPACSPSTCGSPRR
ncbi:hypothetical protein V2I01_36155 [Micromonospora sp. BRA006-A]|nr:hypothetical protein [Micromonospora sp. BRA006-A]